MPAAEEGLNGVIKSWRALRRIIAFLRAQVSKLRTSSLTVTFMEKLDIVNIIKTTETLKNSIVFCYETIKMIFLKFNLFCSIMTAHICQSATPEPTVAPFPSVELLHNT